MKRTTVTLPDDLAAALEREARRRRVPISQVVRESLEARLGRGSGERRVLAFAALGRSGYHTTARDLDKLIEAEWTLDRDC